MYRDDIICELKKAQSEAVGVEMRYDDCLIWLADIYKNALGVDPAQSWRGAYCSSDEMWAKLGWRGIYGATLKAARTLQWPKIEPKDARLGDLGLVVAEDNLHAGVIYAGKKLWVGRIDMGFGALPTSAIIRAWSVRPCQQ